MYKMMTVDNETCLDDEDVLPDWTYVATVMYNDPALEFSEYELWHIMGGAALYRINTDEWFMVNKNEWTHLGYGFNKDPKDIQEASKTLPYSYWEFTCDSWKARWGRPTESKSYLDAEKKGFLRN